MHVKVGFGATILPSTRTCELEFHTSRGVEFDNPMRGANLDRVAVFITRACVV